MSRITDYILFSRVVQEHILAYTVPQYGDSPDDEVENWSTEQCVLAIQKYTKRFISARRGRLETLRDMLKIAHFACIAYMKMLPEADEIQKLKNGVN